MRAAIAGLGLGVATAYPLPTIIAITALLNVGKRRASKGVKERYEGLWRSPLADHVRTHGAAWREPCPPPSPVSPPGFRCRFAVKAIPRFIAAIRRGYATARTSNGRTYPNRGLCHAAEAQVLRSVRTSIAHGRCIMRNHDLVSPHADSGQPRAAGFELAGFLGRVRRLLPRCFGLLTALLDSPQPIGFVLVGIISGRRRYQLRALLACAR